MDNPNPEIASDLEAGYVAMASDEAREAEALEWSEALIDDLDLS
jgi:hypothetical protein